MDWNSLHVTLHVTFPPFFLASSLKITTTPSTSTNMAKRKLEKSNAAKLKTEADLEVSSKPNGSLAAALPSSDEESVADVESEDESNESEEDEEEEEEQEEQKNNGPPKKKQKSQVTAQDVQAARETAELFKSNIFKLQIDELVNEVKIKDSHVAKIEKALHRLHHCISQIPATEQLTLEEAEKKINTKKLVIPFPDPKPTKVNYKFGYLPPENVALVGSFGLKTGIAQQHGLGIDISLVMPKLLFSPKDYLNYRALYKRSFYMAYLAEHLLALTKKEHLPVKMSYFFLNDDVLCPVLKLESIKTDNEDDLSFHKTKFTINLIVSFPFGVFDTKKLLPDKNCIRVQSDTEDLPPTPYYNSSVVSMTTQDYYLKYLYRNKKSADAFKDACTLGRLWLQQRGFGSALNKGGFGHFEFAILLSALLNGGGNSGNKILLHGFSSYQLFKGAIKYLATMDLTTGYLSFSSDLDQSTASKYVPEAGFNTPTIFDKNVKLNVLWKMSKSSYQALRQLAINTFELLNDVVYDRFDAIFLRKAASDMLKYDLVFKLAVPEELHDAFGALEKITFITFDNYIKHKLFMILKNALGERVTSIEIINDKVNDIFPLLKRKPSSQHSNSYTIGIELNPDECDKIVTKGPNDTDEEAAARFRSFWGSKASLRRFKDGTIQHCVVWSIENNEPVTSAIVHYVLGLHLHPTISQHLKSTISHFNAKLPIPLAASAAGQGVTGTTNFTLLKESFEELCKIMYNLELPLSVKSILPASPSLRNTSILQPVPFAVSNPDFWNDVVLQFESSSRWPDEIKALEKTKTAFLLKVSETLNKESTYKCFLTKDNSIPYMEDITLMNVLTPGGYGFRFRVLSERDEILYLRAVTNAGNQKAMVQNVYLKFNQKYLGSVKHSRTISILSTHFPYYSPTVRLFKQWLDAQVLLSHLNDELVELIALKPFVDPAPYTVPNSVEKGFLQVLDFMSSWNWKDDGLILDLVKRADAAADELDNKLSDKLTIRAHQMIQSNFDKIRKTDPSAMKTQFFVGTRDDPSGILWSSDVTLPIASRLTALSRAAMLMVKQQGVDDQTLKLVFTPALNDFDFHIQLRKSDLGKSSGVLKLGGYKNLSGNYTSFPDDITSRYDLTAAFVEELNKAFGNVILFSRRKCLGLYDGENIVCGVFLPNTGNKKFRVSLAMDVKPSDEKDEVTLNKQDVLDQIKLLGGDLVKNVKSKK